MALAENAQVLTTLAVKDLLSPGVNKALGSVGKLNSGLSRTAGGMGKVSTGFARAGTRIAGAAVAGFAGAAKAAIDWEDAFQGVVKTVDASDADLKALAGNLRNLSTEMPTTAIDLAHIAEAAGQMGVGFNEATGKTNTAAIAAFTKQVAILAETTNISADDAATAIGQLTNIIGLGADEFDNFAAALVDLGNKGSSTESQILEIERRSGGAAKLIGVAKTATLGWSAAAANLGLRQELAGTALQKFFLTSQSLVNRKGGLRDMAHVAGMTGAAFKKLFAKDASGALAQFVAGLKKLPKAARLQEIEGLFGKGGGLTRLIIGLSDSVDTNLNPALADSAKAWKEATAAQAEFDKRNATIKSAFARLRNGVIDAAVTLGEGFAPALGRAADKLAAFLKLPENRKALQDLGKDIGKTIDGVDWGDVLSGAKDFIAVLRVAFDWAKRIFDVLNALPTEVKAAGLGFLTLNKLSGGLIGSGVGDIVGGLGESVVKGGLSRVPGVSSLVATPVRVVNWPVGGLGGTGGGIAGAAGGGLGKAATGLAAVGMTVAAVAAVEAVREEISAQSTAQGQALQAQLAAGINVQTPEQLQTSLNAVNQGINDLQSNPLNVLVQGDALNSLKSMKADLESKIATKALGGRDTDKSIAKGISPATTAAIAGLKAPVTADVFDHGTAQTTASVAATTAAIAAGVGSGGTVPAAVADGKVATVAALQQTTTAATGAGLVASNASRAAGNQTAASQQVAASRIVGAIWAARPIIQSTNITQSTTVIQRAGPTGGSRNTHPVNENGSGV